MFKPPIPESPPPDIIPGNPPKPPMPPNGFAAGAPAPGPAGPVVLAVDDPVGASGFGAVLLGLLTK